jgi:hypothetical protein
MIIININFRQKNDENISHKHKHFQQQKRWKYVI